MKNKILIIGNSGIKHNGTDGQTVKVRLYLEIFKLEKVDYEFIDLENFVFKFPKVLFAIRKKVTKCTRIVLLTGQRGIKYLLPYINRINKKKIPLILPMIGCNIINKYLSNFSEQEMIQFFEFKKKIVPTKKDFKNINKIDLILPENDVVDSLVKFVFPNAKTKLLENFRLVEKQEIQEKKNNNNLKLIYFSRVSTKKGIFDLLNVVSCLCEKGFNISLDIYGKTYFSKKEMEKFKYFIKMNNINYLGPIQQKECINIMKNYDLFVFPTNFRVEGTPGAVVEALLAGTPVLSSSYLNHSCLLNKKNALIFEQFNTDDLKNKIIFAYNNMEKLKILSKNCIEDSKFFSYDYNRDAFLRFVCGNE